jgi:hypothetical protein
VEVSVVCAEISELVDQPWIAVKVENDRFVCSEQAVEVAV